MDGRAAGEGGEEADATRLAVEEREALGLGAVLRKVVAGADLMGFARREEDAVAGDVEEPGGIGRAGRLEGSFNPQI